MAIAPPTASRLPFRVAVETSQSPRNTTMQPTNAIARPAQNAPALRWRIRKVVAIPMKKGVVSTSSTELATEV